MEHDRPDEEVDRDENGDWELLESLSDESEATLVAGLLESRGIPAHVESRMFRQEPVTFGALGMMRVLVPSEHLEEARRLLAQLRSPEGEEPSSEPPTEESS